MYFKSERIISSLAENTSTKHFYTMIKKTISIALLSLALFSCKEKTPELTPEEALVKRAKEIHEKVLTIDTHADINVANFTDSINYTQDLDTQVTLPKMEAGGLDVAWFIVYTGQGELTEQGYEVAAKSAMEKFDAIHKLVTDFAPEKIGLATSSKEIRDIHAQGKMVAMIGVENGYSLGTDLTNFEKFYKLGARYISLSHNGHSQFCDSNTGEADSLWLYNGLSDLGKQAVTEMNRLGIMIDVSHPSKESMKQMIALSKAPIIASHSSARALCNHSRNLDDEQLLLMKENGGVVQTVAFSAYTNTEKHEAFNKARQELLKKVGDEMGFERKDRSEIMKMDEASRTAYLDTYKKVQKAAEAQIEKLKETVIPVNVADFVDHIDYMVKLIGIDHVGISSDFDGGGGVEGWNDASETFNVTLELVRRGYSEEEIAKLWGENLLRVLDEVQAVAQKLQSQS